MAGFEEVKVHGYEEFCKAVSERQGKDIFAYFSGDKDEGGRSWCPDCVKGYNLLKNKPHFHLFFNGRDHHIADMVWVVNHSQCFSDTDVVLVCYAGPDTAVLLEFLITEPVVRGELSHLPEGSVFIYCQVGDRPYWKDPNNEFKKTLKLTGVPTLLHYGTPQKLVEEQCFKADLVRMMFTED